MAKLSKRIKLLYSRIDITKQYDIIEGLELLRKLSTVNFIEGLDISVNLNIDTSKPEQNIHGSVILPYGTGRTIRIAAFAQGIYAEEIKKSGIELVGMDDLANKIKSGELNFDIVVASVDAMHVVNCVAKILGPKGLMPNLKDGTITSDIVQTIRNIQLGQVRYKSDKNGIVHSTIGRINFDSYKLKDNLKAFLLSLKQSKPPQIKEGIYIKRVHLSTTMGPSLLINQNNL